MAYEHLLLEQPRPFVLQATINRPDSANAINTRAGEELLHLWRSLAEDPGETRCVVLTGAGDRVFCAGGDLRERNGMTAKQFARQHHLFERLFMALWDCPVPIICAVQGHAFAGGLEIALSCDFIYASEAATFALTEVSIGIMPGGGGTVNLTRAVGARRAKELILSARPFSAAEALDWGVVNRVLPSGAVLEAALEAAVEIAGNAPLSVRQAKKSIQAGLDTDLHSAYRFEIEAYNHLIDTEDRREGILAFNEGRKPVFHGR